MSCPIRRASHSSEAQTALASLRLGVETIEQFDEVVQPGTVISWSVPGDATLTTGSMVEPDTVVQLVLSKGPAPRVVPNIIGVAVADATTQLASMQLTLSQGDQVFSDDFPLGSVVSQSVAEGTEVPRGTRRVGGRVAWPDIVVFPDISAATTYEQAAAILGPAGFQPVLTFGDAQGSDPERGDRRPAAAGRPDVPARHGRGVHRDLGGTVPCGAAWSIWRDASRS